MSMKLCGKKLDGQAIANNAMNMPRDHGIKNFRSWVCASLDRAGNNGVAIKSLKAKNVANLTHRLCHLRRINLLEKEFDNSCKLMNTFRKN